MPQRPMPVASLEAVADPSRGRCRVVAPRGRGVQPMSRSGKQPIHGVESRDLLIAFGTRNARLIDSRQERKLFLGEMTRLPNGTKHIPC